MAKCKTLIDINIRDKENIIDITKGSYIEVTESMAIFLCNEDIATMTQEQKDHHKRTQKAIRTPQDEQGNIHTDYTSI